MSASWWDLEFRPGDIPTIWWVLVMSVGAWLALRMILETWHPQRLSILQRVLLPIPIILMLGSNVDALLSFGAYVNQGTFPIAGTRYPDYQAWNSDRLALAGFGVGLLLPVFVATSWRYLFRTVVLCWGVHIAWLMLAMIPLWFATGMGLVMD